MSGLIHISKTVIYNSIFYFRCGRPRTFLNQHHNGITGNHGRGDRGQIITMTPWNGKVFRIRNSFWVDSTKKTVDTAHKGHQCEASMLFIRLNKMLNKQSSCRWFNTSYFLKCLYELSKFWYRNRIIAGVATSYGQSVCSWLQYHSYCSSMLISLDPFNSQCNQSGGKRLKIKMLHKYRHSHYKDKTVSHIYYKWKSHTYKNLGFYSLSGRGSYHKISWSLKAARLDFIIITALQLRCL